MFKVGNFCTWCGNYVEPGEEWEIFWCSEECEIENFDYDHQNCG